VDVTNEFEARYTERAHRFEITIRPKSTSEIAVARSKLHYGRTVVLLGTVIDGIRDVPGVESAYPRGDRIYFTVAKENDEEFSRILDNVFAVIETELEYGTTRTKRRLANLSDYAVVTDETDEPR